MAQTTNGAKITESYEFKTDIITSYSGIEQRIKTRQVPRHYMSFDYDAINLYQAQWLRGMSRIPQNETWYVPLWCREVFLKEDFTEHGKILYIDTDYFYNLDGVEWIEVFFHDDFTQKECNIVRRVDHYSSNAITLRKKIDIPLYAANTHIFPLIKCSVQPNGQINYIYSNGTKTSMSFEDLLIEPLINIPYNYRTEYDYGFDKNQQLKQLKEDTQYKKGDIIKINGQYLECKQGGKTEKQSIDISNQHIGIDIRYGTAIFSIISPYKGMAQFNRWNLPEKENGIDILLNEPQWVDDSDYSIEIDRNTNKLDTETGIFLYDMKNKFTYDTHTSSIILKDIKQINNMIKFFKNMSGMQKSFYAPTWVNDLEACMTIWGNKNVIYTIYTNLYKFYANNSRKKKIVVFTTDWQSYIFEIKSYTHEKIDNIDYGKLILTEEAGVTIPIEKIKMISYLNRVRFCSDKLTLNYESVTVAQTTLAMKEVDDT